MELKLQVAFRLRVSDLLLIVPYGIETWSPANPFRSTKAFNRTLWN